MSIPEQSAWPTTVDGTTDWEQLFENEETGLIAKLDACSSPDQLKAQSEAIVRAIFVRKRDQPIIAKVMAYLDNLIPQDADQGRFPVMQAGVQQLFRKVKDDRTKKAAAYVEKKALRKKRKKKPNRRASPVADFFQKNHTAMATLILLLGALVPLGIYLGSPKVIVAGGNIKEHIRWVDNYIYNHLPQDTWVLQSVKQSKAAQIAVEILITDPAHIDAIHAMRRIARVAVLTQVCPDATSGIKDITDLGWSLWIVLNGPDEVLTGGTCHYE